MFIFCKTIDGQSFLLFSALYADYNYPVMNTSVRNKMSTLFSKNNSPIFSEFFFNELKCISDKFKVDLSATLIYIF